MSSLRVTLIALFLAIFIDSVGISLFIPLANSLFIDSQGILPIDASSLFRSVCYGLSIGVFSLMGFFGAPLLGAWSDRAGRKCTLLTCLAASCVGYLLCALGVVCHSLSLILIGRMIDGFTGGSLSIAQAAIVDITPIEQRASRLGTILLAASLGFILGPLAAGVLSNPHWCSWFDLTTPLLFAALLSAINFVWLYQSFQETFIPKAMVVSKKMLAWAFSDATIRPLAMIFLLLQIAWATYFEFINVFLAKKYHFDNQSLGLFLSLIGVCYVFSFSYLLKALLKRFSLYALSGLGLSTMALAIAATVGIEQPMVAWIAVIPAAISLAVSYSVLITLFANSVDSDHQGRIMGFSSAISALSFGGTALISGFMAAWDVSVPLIMALICAASGACIAWWYKNSQKIAVALSVE